MGWAIGGTLALVGMMLVSMLVFLPLFGRSDYVVGLYQSVTQLGPVCVSGQAFAPEGVPSTIADDQMVAVKKTDQGSFLYAPRREVRGGGGGALAPSPQLGAPAGAYTELYVRTDANQYVAMHPEQPVAKP